MIEEGTVFRVHSGNYYVAVDDKVVVCKLRGNLKKEFTYHTSGSMPRRVEHARKMRRTDPIAVGDRVRIDSVLKVIESVAVRTAHLSRLSPSRRGQHTLVANLDQVLIVSASAEPNPDLWLLDRFIVMAEASDLEVVLVVNKMDLVAQEREAVAALFSAYKRIGYPVHYVSARQGDGIAALHDALRSKISAFAGPSGVGKSRLLNALCPGADRKVGDVGSLTHKGRHTTTSAELIPLDSAGASWIADTPGLQQVDFWEVESGDVQFCFREFEPFLGGCRFAGCRHLEEPGCRVRLASEQGEIDRRRYRSYEQIVTALPGR